MARRGKVKYKDVVKKPNGMQHKKGKMKKNIKPRKTYSLYGTKNNSIKRKFWDDKNVYEPSPKEQKVEQKQQDVEEDLSSEEEPADLDNLLSTFSNQLSGKNSLAIDSSESEDEESEEEDVNESRDDKELDQELENIEDNEEVEDSDEDELSSSEDDETANIEVSGDSVRVNDRKDIGEGDQKNGEKLDSDDEESICSLDIDKEDEPVNDKEDNFNQHVLYELHDTMLDSLQSSPVTNNTLQKSWPVLGKLSIQIPKCDVSDDDENKFTISEKKIYAPQGTVPTRLTHYNIDKLYIKPQIVKNLRKVNKKVSNSETFTPLQEEILSIINNYQDFYYPGRTFNNSEEIRFIYCVHAVNHILKTRLKIIHHNARLTKKDDVPEEFRDQGLVRPKVLFVLPFKDSAYKTIQLIIDLILPENKGNVMNKNRFIEDYTGNELYLPKKNPKPEDYEQLFQGNTSDDFKIGITVTKKSLKLYADFYSSDIIIASPLGLRTIIGAEGEAERDYDFLASIELLIMDQADIFLMQNWDHVMHVLSHLHMQPKDSHGTDFSRVRTWSLNGWAKYYRQTLIFSSNNLPEINAVFNKKCHNFAGKVKVVNPIEFGCISQVVVQIPHVFHRFDCKNAADAIDARFEFFINKILPQQRETLMKHTLIFIPSYFDFVRVRNYFKKEDIGFVQICEYSKDGKVARARDMFFHGDAHFLLYTERFHFFHRRRIKGIRHIVFYQPPTFPNFYYEMCNLMQENNLNKKSGGVSNMTVSVMYSKYDIYQLSAIVGTEKSAKMIQSDRKVHMMVTGSD
ncbi:U3 small nucleolar RNA-associated protein 25 homolog [Diabrotica virgifera virgifera]|uniref:U3 small nucleolar RNA-associated protein 25 homolog n=1 Tax=Diabrotica virgifera virgifera TaxID=50390 RepID=A0ABM5K2S7_DIAVI|nr:U3 small nucleolar RNA-associated protein 25 homolog [Diabrotica virgifera virgifera]